MRRLLFLAAITLAACGNPTNSAPATTTQTAAATTHPVANQSQIWFFCDGIDTPVIYLFADTPDDGQVRFIEYDKRNGATRRTSRRWPSPRRQRGC